MELIYTTKEKVNMSRVDRFSRLSPTGLLSMLQEMAVTHAARLGAGREEMARRDLFWAVIRQSVEITRMPRLDETITLETWPGEPTRMAYPRYTLARDEKGELLFQAVALWLPIEIQARKMLLPEKNEGLLPGISRENQLPAPRSIPALREGRECRRCVRYSELDANGHMSNTRYLNWLEDLLPSGFHREHPLERFRIAYISEAREGEELTLRWNMGEDGELALEASRPLEGRQERVFAIRARYR